MTIVFALGFVAGGAAIWFGKTKIQELVLGMQPHEIGHWYVMG
jgi:hypothetical protein